MIVVYDEKAANVKLIDTRFGDTVFEAIVHDEIEIEVIIDFFLLYANIISFS